MNYRGAVSLSIIHAQKNGGIMAECLNRASDIQSLFWELAQAEPSHV